MVLFHAAMGLVLAARAIARLLAGLQLRHLDARVAWREPICLFGFVYIIVTKLGFVPTCKPRAEAETSAQARTDRLTGLPTRRALGEAIAIAIATSRSGRPFAIVMADIDRFKAMNDAFGHAAGHAILASFATHLREALRAPDKACRHGGEEFCLVRPDTELVGTQAVAERARERVTLPADTAMLVLTASFGIAAWRAVDALFGRADRAPYRAKTSGRNPRRGRVRPARLSTRCWRRAWASFKPPMTNTPSRQPRARLSGGETRPADVGFGSHDAHRRSLAPGAATTTSDTPLTRPRTRDAPRLRGAAAPASRSSPRDR